VGDFEKADVLIDGKRIAEIAPTVSASDAEIVDCSGTIVMPGFITTHHHQYETLQRSIIPDGLLAGAWPQESYGSVVQNIWTAGRITDPANPNAVVWDLGRAPYDPEDCYISELVACLSEISEGITTGTDTSQSSHTPEHTDAMIKGLMDSGRRVVYAYTGGINRTGEGIPYEFPGAMNDTTKGIGRIAKTYFSSKDQLVTLGFGGGPGPAIPGADFTGWQLARAFRRIDTQPQRRRFERRDQCGGRRQKRKRLVRCDLHPLHTLAGRTARSSQLRFAWLPEGEPIESVGDLARQGRPCLDCDAHRDADAARDAAVSAGARPRHPAQSQPRRRHEHDDGIRFSLMRGAYCLQRALANDLAFPESNPGGLPVPQVVTSRQVIEMATIAGAASNRVLNQVGTLTPGKEADIIVLDARSINTWPMNNVPGTIVTMMNPGTSATC
jgi:cytosine/adenosine deaminase-related metal-dependent hydrolase